MMSLERRLQILSWAHKTGAFVIEDDYDGSTDWKDIQYLCCKT
jgi:DNA-binding transcriptional MocR family regulator